MTVTKCDIVLSSPNRCVPQKHQFPVGRSFEKFRWSASTSLWVIIDAVILGLWLRCFSSRFLFLFFIVSATRWNCSLGDQGSFTQSDEVHIDCFPSLIHFFVEKPPRMKRPSDRTNVRTFRWHRWLRLGILLKHRRCRTSRSRTNKKRCSMYAFLPAVMFLPVEPRFVDVFVQRTGKF